MTVVWRIMPPVFRFAPSPNGYLHLGHAYSALLNFDLARRAGGRFLLRIEDIDATRCRPEFEAAIYEDLAWLGISWETPVRRQSEHFANYRDALEKLAGLGLIYPSFESRVEIARLVAQREADAPWPRDPDGAPLYPGAAKSLSSDRRRQLIAQGTPYALRLDMQAALARTKELAWHEDGAGPAGDPLLGRNLVAVRDLLDPPVAGGPGEQREHRGGEGPVPGWNRHAVDLARSDRSVKPRAARTSPCCR